MEQHIKRAEWMATLLENQFQIFGFRFGLTTFVDLIPGGGDLIDALLSMYIVWIAIEMELPLIKVIQMLWNVGLSFLIGLIPIAGDLGYIFYRPNTRNLRIIQEYRKAEVIEGKIIYD